MTQQRPATDDQLKALLGEEDFNELMTIRTKKAERATRAKIKEVADAMVSVEGGKYYIEYSRLDKQIDDLYQKATREAETLVKAGKEAPQEGGSGNGGNGNGKPK